MAVYLSKMAATMVGPKGEPAHSRSPAQSRQNLRCSLIQAMSQEEPSDKKPDPWPL